ncbi:MAG: hypothetical protein IJN42_06615, partial [Clostridia bacterium]|nr:hypothetical protein [Clostridia bacterium]
TATNTKAEDLKDSTTYEDELVAKEYELYDLLLEIKGMADGTEKDLKQAAADALQAEVDLLKDLYNAAIFTEDAAALQEELAAENKLHEENLAAINA